MTFDPRTLLDTPLPPGRPVASAQGGEGALWLSDGPAAPGLWARIRAEHARTGLWPLLLDSRDPDDSELRPWASGELSPEDMSSPEAHDPAGLLAQWWRDHTADEEGDEALPAGGRAAVTAPFGQRWPGLAPGRPAGADPGKEADEYAGFFGSLRPHLRLGLVAAASGADALAVAGWEGPVNYDNDTAKFSAVLRTWEQRFGARVVAVGFDTLHLSIATPPIREEDALLVAAEHFAFCPDNIWQNSLAQSLASYAERLVDSHAWDFWWD
ncbi:MULTISPECIES: DUF4253 domain-containing protein [Streptomyces]|uniref:DUF4253 domain-containing protein n=1 Tax=Streptomyces tsukubensis (strain DSM 42081 / NBRC 108919 / NRRL 18488 / 9993) TaxID=1114943 RepID=I2MZV1_STRT9|nr:DUF4253 domain-containing protein [Streptomyces tsukubensis]MYS67491.1 DUF4253 domain-containing protein [Streptomyces sp. SID5473]AZK94542.1 hypothetical protein B7R87_12220 [Streptomyces tsukubensis]EIF90298.1 hypothetical protein [Streptomyces tsukubensis NRRL18488]QKM69368.1 DUF4253 domain-containing protein [Streptomyces tsukubensis NRRL18488]TAI42698.1 DUF4253 domain-containing protein [Streptomyces tsukubensis]